MLVLYFLLIPFPARSFAFVEEQGTVASAFGCVYLVLFESLTE